MEVLDAQRDRAVAVRFFPTPRAEPPDITCTASAGGAHSGERGTDRGEPAQCAGEYRAEDGGGAGVDIGGLDTAGPLLADS